VQMLRNGSLDGLFGATIQATEEAIINALRSITNLGDRSRLKAVRTVRDSDPSLRVRQAAIETLQALGA